jgi:hypothetical protein
LISIRGAQTSYAALRSYNKETRRKVGGDAKGSEGTVVGLQLGLDREGLAGAAVVFGDKFTGSEMIVRC